MNNTKNKRKSTGKFQCFFFCLEYLNNQKVSKNKKFPDSGKGIGKESAARKLIKIDLI